MPATEHYTVMTTDKLQLHAATRTMLTNKDERRKLGTKQYIACEPTYRKLTDISKNK